MSGCAGVFVNVTCTHLHVSVQYLRARVCRRLLMFVSTRAPRCTRGSCAYICARVCAPGPTWVHVYLCPHACTCGAGLSGTVEAERPRSRLWQPQGVGVGPRRPGSLSLPARSLSPSQAQSWESLGLLGFRAAWAVCGRAANPGCGAICRPSPFRSCGFLRAWGSCPLRPPLPVLVRPGGQDTPPTPRPHPQEAGLGGRRWGRCHAGRPALCQWLSTPLLRGRSSLANSPGGIAGPGAPPSRPCLAGSAASPLGASDGG